ncbi:Stk1 family PASTA domain-containing Ser/Thr kinase [Pseudonocardia sp. GCM10023141]|uniref:Stk1 family PASTA domain-containing Ser/Thr kinase n=1 Tax=Pseudonocardia sp. GCM10023141 TaxID=3252653 RepID=UPI003623307D
MTTPRLLSERYELGEVLGYGGMSEVHRGLDTRLGRDVAVKVLRADLARDPQFQMRFRREAQNAASLNHPAIVSVYDTGEVQSEFGPLPYIVMEYVDGQTLREIVKTSGPMTQQKVIEVMADVCAALDFSHRHQIIHRDVKPANIMINRAGAVKVMDFGIARALGEGQNVTQTAAVIGTAQYLSPEQARGEAVDARSDVYAAGCVLYELLTGEPPFTGDTPVAVAYQHVREDPKRPSTVNPSIPPELDSVVLKALSKNPANRYQSAAEMRTDLVRVRSGQSPMAPAVMSDDERTAMLAAGPGTGPTRRLNGGRHAPPPAAGYDDYYDDEPRRRTGRLIAIIAGVVVALAAVGFVAYQLLSGPPAAKQVSIPSLVGQTETQAGNTLIGLGLRLTQPSVKVESSLDQKDKVISTTPPAGSSTPAGTTVTLNIGGGPASVSVPAILNLSSADADKQLKARGLVLGNTTTQETSDTSKIDKVVSSNPAPGTDVAGGSKVDIVVGVAPTKITIPDVKGSKTADAQKKLTDLGLVVTVQQADAGNGDDGTAAGTDPAANSQVAKGSAVTLYVNGDPNGGGTGNGRVPNVKGMSLDDAATQLRSQGYNNISQTPQTVTNRNDDGKVLSQTPAANSRADSNQQIVLTVGKFPGGTFGN